MPPTIANLDRQPSVPDDPKNQVKETKTTWHQGRVWEVKTKEESAYQFIKNGAKFLGRGAVQGLRLASKVVPFGDDLKNASYHKALRALSNEPTKTVNGESRQIESYTPLKLVGDDEKYDPKHETFIKENINANYDPKSAKTAKQYRQEQTKKLDLDGQGFDLEDQKDIEKFAKQILDNRGKGHPCLDALREERGAYYMPIPFEMTTGSKGKGKSLMLYIPTDGSKARCFSCFDGSGNAFTNKGDFDLFMRSNVIALQSMKGDLDKLLEGGKMLVLDAKLKVFRSVDFDPNKKGLYDLAQGKYIKLTDKVWESIQRLTNSQKVTQRPEDLDSNKPNFSDPNKGRRAGREEAHHVAPESSHLNDADEMESSMMEPIDDDELQAMRGRLMQLNENPDDILSDLPPLPVLETNPVLNADEPNFDALFAPSSRPEAHVD